MNIPNYNCLKTISGKHIWTSWVYKKDKDGKGVYDHQNRRACLACEKVDDVEYFKGEMGESI